ncbi:hypothetical protein [Roseicyclus persicicus]|uniref:Uncharacterized protein n=1 Tax=Roseicyclus persicicus TaxID=2650661 RepID=A0A7X6GY57_9RHOB|nr:hypothetical protein [Roseibacterium persicicum]NKX44574.1 hypothetical protein [Roseibacterium persicicum]
MRLTRLIRVAALTAATVTAGASMTLAQGVPAEIPPASYSGDQYTDSRGCIFVRVGVGSATEWVPRVGRDRNQLCGYTPTLGAGTATAAAPAADRTPGVTVIGAAPAATATTTSRPAATATRPAAPAAPAVRSVATQPRPVATQPRPVATQPRAMPQPAAPAATGPCPNLPAEVRQYFTGPNPRCGPQAVHPGDAARGIDRTSAVTGGGEIRQVVRYEVNPPAGYRAAWDDDRMNPYRGLAFAGGQRQMEQVWTNTVPRRLVGTEPRGFRSLFEAPSRPATIVPAQLVVVRP